MGEGKSYFEGNKELIQWLTMSMRILWCDHTFHIGRSQNP